MEESHEKNIEITCLGGSVKLPLDWVQKNLGSLFDDVEPGEEISIPVNIKDLKALIHILEMLQTFDIATVLRHGSLINGMTHYDAMRAGAFLGVKTPEIYNYVYQREIKAKEAHHEWFKVFSKDYLFKY